MSQSDPKKDWEVLKSIICRKGKATRVEQLSDAERGRLITVETVEAEKFNEYFANIRIHSCKSFVTSDSYVNYLRSNITEHLKFSHINLEELETVINSQ